MSAQKHVSFYRGHRITLMMDGIRWLASVNGAGLILLGIGTEATMQDYEAHAAACQAIDESLARG